MAIHNINTIQNPNDVSYLVSYYANYNMYESLANLGQRYSIAGDSIVTKQFNVGDILNVHSLGNISEFEKTYISKLYTNEGKLFLSVYDKSNIQGNAFLTEEIKYSLNNAVITDIPLALNTKINGIDYYKENMLIYKDDVYLYIASLGCCDDSVGISELNIEKYNIKTNTLVESLKFINTNEEGINNYTNNKETPKYYLYHLRSKFDNNEYELGVYSVKISLIKDTYNHTFDSFCLYFYNSLIIQYFNTYKFLNISDIISELTQFGFDKIYTNDDNSIRYLDVSYNGNQTTGFTLSDLENTQINTILHYIYNQTVHMYLYIFEYYCNYVYKSDNRQLNKQILYNLYEIAYSEACSLNEDTNNEIINKTNFELYIPLNYAFDYYCNSNNEFYIYSNETPVSIFYTSSDITQNFIDNFYNKQIQLLLCNSLNIETAVLYKYSVDYNENNKNIINNISVNKLYSTPYIQDDYWVLNSIKSAYRAVGKNAGNPNILLLYVDNISNLTDVSTLKNEIQFISAIDEFVSIDTLSWEIKNIEVQLFNETITTIYNTHNKDKISSTNKDGYYGLNQNYTLRTVVPVLTGPINENIKEQLKNSFIFNISNIENVLVPSKSTIDNLSKEIIQKCYDDGIITTLWKYDAVTDKFVGVIDPITNNTVLTLNKISNSTGFISDLITTKLNDLSVDVNFNHIPFIELENKTIAKNQGTDTQYSTYITHSIIPSNPIYDLIGTRYKNENGVLSEESDNNPCTYNVLSIHPNGNKNRLSGDICNSQVFAANINNINTYEYLPVNEVPRINLSEILLSDAQVLNRINIITPSKNDNDVISHYYTYIGSSIYDKEKNVVHFGTSTYNYHINSELSENINFKKHNEISIDFDNIILNSAYTINKASTVERNSYSEKNELCNIKYKDLIYKTNNYSYYKLCVDYKFINPKGDNFENKTLFKKVDQKINDGSDSTNFSIEVVSDTSSNINVNGIKLSSATLPELDGKQHYYLSVDKTNGDRNDAILYDLNTLLSELTGNYTSNCVFECLLDNTEIEYKHLLNYANTTWLCCIENRYNIIDTLSYTSLEFEYAVNNAGSITYCYVILNNNEKHNTYRIKRNS